MQADPQQLDAEMAKPGDAVFAFGQRHWRILVAVMLLLLHVAALRGVADGWARALLVAHFGFVLLWQPFLGGQQRISGTQAGLIIAFATVVTLYLNGWMLAFWVVILAGRKVYRQQARWQRRSYLALFLYLVALLVVVILPEVSPGDEISKEVKAIAAYGLPILIVVACLLPTEPEPEQAAEVVDLFYSVFLMLLLGLIVLGSFTFMTLGHVTYLQAMTYTLFAIAVTVLALGLTWAPRAGFAGINVFFVRYLLSIGLPLEQWLFFLSELSRREQGTDRFLSAAVERLLRLPWVCGVQWSAGTELGEAGTRSDSSVDYARGELSLTIYSRFRISPALHWHLMLVAQLLAEFYVAKLREQALQQQSYLQAIHETGARVTHDVKNLLQSLNVLCSVIARDASAGSPQGLALVRTQLPLLAQRLTATLERLQRPAESSNEMQDLDFWWNTLRLQYGGQDVRFERVGATQDCSIPRELFDSVAENLLQNALAKRALDRESHVSVELSCVEGKAGLRVRDTGSAVPAEVEKKMFRAPLRSQRGLGIGLYQAAQRAAAAGFILRLAENRDGAVCFELTCSDQGSTPAETSRP